MCASLTCLLCTELPGAPEAPLVEEIFPENARLSWSPPADDGGAPIEGYVVEVRRKGDIQWKPANEVPEPQCTAPGLEPETEYEFRVAARNKAGQGPFSKPSNVARYGERRGLHDLGSVGLLYYPLLCLS